MSAYIVPVAPADPAAAALELIVRLPADVLGHADPAREVLQEFAGVLDAENVFAEMSWRDAKHAATAIVFDAINRDDAAAFLRGRADRIAAGTDGLAWDDSAAMVRAFRTAATVLSR